MSKKYPYRHNGGKWCRLFFLVVHDPILLILAGKKNIYLVQKETQCFHLQFLGLKIFDFKNCFNSVVLPSNEDLDCIVSL